MIVEASLSGALKVIFYFLLFSFILSLVLKMMAPYALRKAEEAMREQARKQHDAFQSQGRKEGEVTVEKETKRPGRSGNDDYVDFIEIKD
jgi:ABC-type sulfate transport system permease component